ncbi:hypothetical protein [Streptomyces sp. NPDC060333]|uniref:hypothetical protein n=1 Tax=Streptomyces sp. NPDC060333 TaxID=3347098 RepID=UPI003669820C
MNGFNPFKVVQPGGRLTPEYLLGIATELGRDVAHWEGRLQHGAACAYMSLFADERLGVWAIVWDQDAREEAFPIQDRSNGGVYVVRGRIRHERLWPYGEPAVRCVSAGEGFSLDATAAHRLSRERGAGPTVTVHAYSPPP